MRLSVRVVDESVSVNLAARTRRLVRYDPGLDILACVLGCLAYSFSYSNL